MKSLLYIATFVIVTPITLVTSLFALTVISAKAPTSSPPQYSLQIPTYGSRVYAAIPDPIGSVEAAATVADGRVELVRQYLKKYDSPLVNFAHEIVSASEENGLDFRLLVAIAQQESNLCKKVPSDSYNCWGWGVHSKGTLRFSGYPDAIETVAQGLKGDYIDKGYTTPEEIMRKYTPLSPGSWATGVVQFLEEME